MSSNNSHEIATDNNYTPEQLKNKKRKELKAKLAKRVNNIKCISKLNGKFTPNDIQNLKKMYGPDNLNQFVEHKHKSVVPYHYFGIQEDLERFYEHQSIINKINNEKRA